jgi:hypothetical protein
VIVLPVLSYQADRRTGRGTWIARGQQTVGRDAIRAVCQKLVAGGLHFEVEEPLPTLRAGDLALTSTRPADNTGGRVQVARRQADGSWLRVIDRPELPR